MNNGRMWTIVNPTVGVPLFFVGLLVASVFVHLNVLGNSDIFNNFVNGKAQVEKVAEE